MAFPLLRKNTGGQYVRGFSVFKSGARVLAPPIESGDFVALVDDVEIGPITVVEIPVGSGMLRASPSQAMTNGEMLTVKCHDQTATAAWDDINVSIPIGILTIDDLLAAAGYTTPPTAAAIADAVGEEPLADHSGVAGSNAEAWETAGSAADPMTNMASDYAIPTQLGYIIAHLGDGQVNLTYPVIGDGGTIHTYRGADYYAADGRSIDWTDTDSTLPSDITGAAVAVVVKDSDGAVVTTFAGSVVIPTGTKQLRLELASASSDDVPVGTYTYRIKVTLAAGMGSHIIPWREGTWISEDL